MSLCRWSLSVVTMWTTSYCGNSTLFLKKTTQSLHQENSCRCFPPQPHRTPTYHHPSRVKVLLSRLSRCETIPTATGETLAVSRMQMLCGVCVCGGSTVVARVVTSLSAVGNWGSVRWASPVGGEHNVRNPSDLSFLTAEREELLTFTVCFLTLTRLSAPPTESRGGPNTQPLCLAFFCLFCVSLSFRESETERITLNQKALEILVVRMYLVNIYIFRSTFLNSTTAAKTLC